MRVKAHTGTAAELRPRSSRLTALRSQPKTTRCTASKRPRPPGRALALTNGHERTDARHRAPPRAWRPAALGCPRSPHRIPTRTRARERKPPPPGAGWLSPHAASEGHRPPCERQRSSSAAASEIPSPARGVQMFIVILEIAASHVGAPIGRRRVSTARHRARPDHRRPSPAASTGPIPVRRPPSPLGRLGPPAPRPAVNVRPAGRQRDPPVALPAVRQSPSKAPHRATRPKL